MMTAMALLMEDLLVSGTGMVVSGSDTGFLQSGRMFTVAFSELGTA